MKESLQRRRGKQEEGYEVMGIEEEGISRAGALVKKQPLIQQNLELL